MAGRRLPHLKKATCKPGHRGRWAVQGEYCRDCVPRAPEMLLAEGPAPDACPHCHTKPPTWHCDELEGKCFACGQRWQRPIRAAYL